MDDKQKLAKMALEVIELLCEEHDLKGDNERLSQIYRIAHAGRSPSCENSHKEWKTELLHLHKEMGGETKEVA